MKKTLLTLALIATSLGTFSAALAQTAPADPKSTQTIPEKDPSAGGKKPPVSTATRCSVNSAVRTA